MLTQRFSPSPPVQRWLSVAGALTILIALARWGGSARTGPLLVVGVLVLAGLIVGFGLLTWWLYLSPLAAGQVAQPVPRSAAVQHLVATLVLASGMGFVFGGFWDEVWHRKFGGFGDDFLWPPHLMIYGSVALVALFAGGGLLIALRGPGNIRQRFRREPLLGLLGLVASYLIASLPSDELWHRIYGRDLTAWSLPHLLLAGGFALVMLVGVGIQLALVPPHELDDVRRLRLIEVPALVMAACATLALLQVGTAEWESLSEIQRGTGDSFRSAFWQRPEWLFPVVVTTVALFSGNFVLSTIRRAGAATLVALLVLGLRLAMLKALGADHIKMGYVTQLLLLAPVLTLDGYALVCKRLDWRGHLLAAAAFLLVGLPLIAQVMVYPRVNSTTMPGMIVMSLVMALVAGRAGAGFGGWLASFERTVSPRFSPARSWATLGVLVVAILVVLAVMTLVQAPAA